MSKVAGLSLEEKHPVCKFKVGGLQEFTLIDFPGRPACVIFTQGCNFRCGYCYNVELVLPERFGNTMPLEEIFDFLNNRVGLLEGVVITGGEPTVQQGLEDFMASVKALNYPIKLDTNGSRPDVLKRLLEKGLLDYVAMDVKAPLYKYSQVCGVHVEVDKILESIRIIMSSGVDYEFRTTLLKEQLTEGDIVSIAKLIKGAKRFYLQRFIPGKTLDPKLSKGQSYSEEELNSIVQSIKDHFEECSFR
ncbi:MAG: anaerobic ribonucleoside-triphosphate reductase activating protein [Aquificaceae bacterium]|nr:anaerobic ribonucleoside-triphosphate reductase activating protein [Aquificaceae bacterium]